MSGDNLLTDEIERMIENPSSPGDIFAGISDDERHHYLTSSAFVGGGVQKRRHRKVCKLCYKNVSEEKGRKQKHTVQSEVTDGSGDPASADSATSAPDHTQLLCLDHLASCDNYSF
ncbi:hypothetical protein J6590_045861 [Homalodisca vitripennis]|nr:hypothetical protein J6590_045861 [Homalodisca vitripennis]